LDAVASRDVGFEVQHGRSIMGVKPSDLQKSFGEVGSARAGYAPHRREGKPQTDERTSCGVAEGRISEGISFVIALVPICRYDHRVAV
jgi:hypothetical protein